MYYNIGSSWEQSSCSGCDGTWMMRPVFGSLTTTNITSKNNSDFEMYPNPSVNIVNISHSQPFTVRVFDIRGAMVYFEKTPFKSLSFTTTKMESGIYIVELNSNNQTLRKKLILN